MPIRLRYWVRLLTAFASRFKAVLFFGIVLGLLLFAFLTYLMPRVFSRDIEYIGVTGRYHTEDLPFFILNMIGQGLTALDEDGSPIPAIAESWEGSSDGTVWTFKLRKDLYWHDGTPVNAHTVQYSFEDAEIERLDDYTIRFNLSSPFAPFPVVVSRPSFKRGLLGTGQWRVENVRLASTFVERLILKNQETSERKVFRFYPSEDSTKIAYQLGEIDIIEDFLDPQPFLSWPKANLNKLHKQDRIVAIFFNNEDPALSGLENKPVRQALSYAINKEAFGGQRAKGPIPPASWAYNPQVKDYAYDPEHAKTLLEGTEGLEINLTTTPTLLFVAEEVKKHWEEIGVTVNVQVVSVLPAEYQAFLAIYDMPKDPDQYAIWHTTQKSSNVSRYSNPRIDKLLEDGRLEMDFEERKKIYLDFQRFLLEDAPAVFMYHPVSYSIRRR